MPPEPSWLVWAKSLQSIAQTGLTFAQDPYDRQRYEEIRRIAAEMMAVGSGVALETIEGLFSAQAGYPTPKVDLRGVVFRDDTILLVREKEDGLWTLPGGWADTNESPAEGVVREVREESGWDTRATRLLAVLDRTRQGNPPPFAFHVYKLFIQCEIIGGGAAPDHEIAEVGFFSRNALPPLSETRVLASQIERMFALRDDSSAATCFE